MGMQRAREEVYASLSTRAAFWGLSGLTRGIVRASASVRPTRCPAHPHAQTKQFISVRYLPQCAQLLIRPRWTPTEKVSAFRLCGGGPPRLAQRASLAASREGESSTVTCPGWDQALHSRFLSCRLWASEKQHSGLKGHPTGGSEARSPLPLYLQSRWGFESTHHLFSQTAGFHSTTPPCFCHQTGRLRTCPISVGKKYGVERNTWVYGSVSVIISLCSSPPISESRLSLQSFTTCLEGKMRHTNLQLGFPSLPKMKNKLMC